MSYLQTFRFVNVWSWTKLDKLIIICRLYDFSWKKNNSRRDRCGIKRNVERVVCSWRCRIKGRTAAFWTQLHEFVSSCSDALWLCSAYQNIMSHKTRWSNATAFSRVFNNGCNGCDVVRTTRLLSSFSVVLPLLQLVQRIWQWGGLGLGKWAFRIGVFRNGTVKSVMEFRRIRFKVHRFQIAHTTRKRTASRYGEVNGFHLEWQFGTRFDKRNHSDCNALKRLHLEVARGPGNSMGISFRRLLSTIAFDVPRHLKRAPDTRTGDGEKSQNEIIHYCIATARRGLADRSHGGRGRRCRSDRRRRRPPLWRRRWSPGAWTRASHGTPFNPCHLHMCSLRAFFVLVLGWADVEIVAFPTECWCLGAPTCAPAPALGRDAGWIGRDRPFLCLMPIVGGHGLASGTFVRTPCSWSGPPFLLLWRITKSRR